MVWARYIFLINEALVENEDEAKNQKSLFHKFGGIFKFMENSFAKFRITERESIICFVQDLKFICLTCDGNITWYFLILK